ncbi:MAG TPA: cyanoexosortase A system-associated protein [Coleofasciculaceae cyanobacterium]|jgi:cyanosortase A-associated protein
MSLKYLQFNQWRSNFLVISSIGINLAVVYALIVPAVGYRSTADFKFPESLSLNSATAIAVKSNLTKPKAKTLSTEIIKSRKKYKYVLDKQEIDLDLNYLVGTRGDVETYLQSYTSLPASIIRAKTVKHKKETGFYTVFSDRDRVYLSSCISPRSPSSVTQRQFSQHRYQNDFQFQVGLDWLKGKESIRDRRCLWVHLSTAITQSDTQAAYEALEAVWVDLYQWWLPNFPPLTAENG